MRRRILVLVAAVALGVASAAVAAPTCQRLDGLTARCGTPGAMPVGWSPSPRQVLERRLSQPPEDTTFEVVGAVGLLGALVVLIAVMPKFDGWEAGDWDEQEGDDAGALRSRRPRPGDARRARPPR